MASLAGAVGDRRYALYVITRPDAAGVLAQRGRGDRWGISRERTAGQPRFADLGEQELTGLIARAVGVGDLRARIERLGSFPFAAQIAERYRERRGFLAGDAAHRMTPRGGTGMNTAIQDSFDLGWKLAWVLRGWASRDLLDTYETERRPVGLHNVKRAGQSTGARASAAEPSPGTSTAGWRTTGFAGTAARSPPWTSSAMGSRYSPVPAIRGGPMRRLTIPGLSRSRFICLTLVPQMLWT